MRQVANPPQHTGTMTSSHFPRCGAALLLAVASATTAGAAEAPATARSAAPTRVLDAHVHITNLSLLKYSDWGNATAGVCPCAAPCLCQWGPSDWQAAASSLSPQKMVFIEVDADPTLNVEEAAWVQALANNGESRIGAIIAKQPPGFGTTSTPDAAIASGLDALMAAAPLLRGIRTYMNFSDGASFPAAVNHTRLLAERGLLLEICLGPLGGDAAATQFVLNLVGALPQATFMIDHLGSPPVLGTAGGMETWYTTVAALGQRPNVWIKVGGAFQYYKPCLTCPAVFPAVAEVAPLVEHVLRSFGWGRCVYEGNWFFVDWFSPADMDVYTKWVSYLAAILASFQPQPTSVQLDNLYWAAGVQVYRILG